MLVMVKVGPGYMEARLLTRLCATDAGFATSDAKFAAEMPVTGTVAWMVLIATAAATHCEELVEPAGDVVPDAHATHDDDDEPPVGLYELAAHEYVFVENPQVQAPVVGGP